MENQKPKPRGWRKLWWFIWEDNSVWSWIVNIILAFVLIKFLVYPGLGFALGTTHPIVAVVSESMDQDMIHPCASRSSSGICLKTNKQIYEICGKTFEERTKLDFDNYWILCGEWYEDNYDISKEQFENFDFDRGFNKGDLMVLTRPTNLELGDIVVFSTSRPSDPIIHRVVSITEDTVSTKGDHNGGVNDFEKEIPQDKLIGKASLRLPYLGWIKLGFVNFIQMIQR